jgi:hypothetical protein
MTDTIREIIIKDFIARLAVITTANGYNTGCGANVQRVRKLLDPDELPACVVWPGAEKAEAIYGELSCTMEIRVEGIAKFGSTNPSVIAEAILGDLKKCILSQYNALTSPHTGWSRSPDYIDSIDYTGGGTDEYPDDGMLSVGASATFAVTYTTKRDDPYSQ